MKRFITLLLALSMVFALAACGGSGEPKADEPEEIVQKNMSQEDAAYQIEVAMQALLEETYGDKVVDARIYVEKVYTAEEEQNFDPLKQMALGPDEYAFEVRYELLPAEGVDVHEMTAATGVFDEESGWIKEKYNVGVLRPNEDGPNPYIITDFGTGF